MPRNRIFVVAGLVAFAAFAAGVVHLFSLRFSAGDVYPIYSSLRSDPLGTKALYESFDGCCGLRVERNYEPFENIKDRRDAVLFFPGEYPPLQDFLPLSFVEDLEYFLRDGGRMVVSYVNAEQPSPDAFGVAPGQDEKKGNEKPDKKDKKKEKEKEERNAREHLVSFTKRWGLQYRTYPLEGATQATLTSEYSGNGLPAALFWHSSLYFDQLDPAWHVLYRREGKAVIMERRFAKGTVILSADSYFLSNEALLRHRYPELLAWLVGGEKAVIFDEYFHGVTANPGVASLARRYRLHGLIAGILLLAGLFLWRNSQSFVPPYPESSEEGESAEGKDSTAGLTNLLRRSISVKDILDVCWQEWKKSSAMAAAGTQNRLERMESTYNAERSASSRQRDPVQAYNRISRILKER